MGYQMARHMVRRGFAVTGYDVAPEAANRAKEAGIRIAANAWGSDEPGTGTFFSDTGTSVTSPTAP